MLQREINQRLVNLEQALEVISNMPIVKEYINNKAKEAIDEEKKEEKMVEDMAKEHEEKEAQKAIEKEQKRIEEQGTKQLVDKKEKKEVVFTEGAKKDFDKIPEEDKKEILQEIDKLAKGEIQGEPLDVEKLKKEEPKVYKEVIKRRLQEPSENYGMGFEGQIKEPLIKTETKKTKEYETKCYSCGEKIKIPDKPEPNTVYRCRECMKV